MCYEVTLSQSPARRFLWRAEPRLWFKRLIETSSYIPTKKVGPPEKVMGALRLAVGGALDPKLPHPMPEGVGVEVQDFRCALRSLDDSVGLL